MLDEEARKRTFEHAIEIWFEPEVRRRQQQGLAPKPFPLRAAQVIIYPDERPHEIRLNEEVQAAGEIKLKPGITKKAGDPIYLNELEGIPPISLPETADPNCGHFTLLLIGNEWYGSFDFRYNRGKASELIAAAEDFLETSVVALAAGRIRPAIDNLFSAAELAATAFVILISFSDSGGATSHGQIHQRFNWLSQHGNVDSDHRKTFNLLSDARRRARYLRSPLRETPKIVIRWQQEIKELISQVGARAT